eukprot:m.64647 g.64647  ORF g.64647 m.64647 type:complete len:61 (+) comp11498_c0_seq3:81-263(+)
MKQTYKISNIKDHVPATFTPTPFEIKHLQTTFQEQLSNDSTMASTCWWVNAQFCEFLDRF